MRAQPVLSNGTQINAASPVNNARNAGMPVIAKGAIQANWSA